jgi:hypothetical protein
METDLYFEISYAAPMKEWVIEALEHAGMSQADLVRELHSRFNWADNRSVLNKIISGSRDLKADEMLHISVATGHPIPGGLPAAQSSGLTPLTSAVQTIHVKGKVAANSWMDVDSMDFGYEDIEPIPSLGGYPPEWQYGLLVEGKCLNKIAAHGDRLVCLDLQKAGINAQPGELVVVERSRYGGQMIERTAKRLKQGPKGLELWPESFEEEHQGPISLSEPNENVEIRIVAKVLWIIRKP